MTNARSRIEEFIERVPLADEDVRMLISFAQRLEIDPYDVPAERDSVGEWHCTLGESVSIPGYNLGVGYRIADARRSVEVISFYGWSGS